VGNVTFYEKHVANHFQKLVHNMRIEKLTIKTI